MSQNMSWKTHCVIALFAATSLGSTAANAQQQPPQSPNMTFFVTSSGPGKGADLGGLEGADRHCQTLATGAGAGSKTWRAYLSSNAARQGGAVNARDRIGNGPWQNFKGVAVAQNVDDLHSDNNKLIAAGTPTIPSTIGEEKTANPFLRADVSEVANAVGLSGSPAWKVFAEIRERKNRS